MEGLGQFWQVQIVSYLSEDYTLATHIYECCPECLVGCKLRKTIEDLQLPFWLSCGYASVTIQHRSWYGELWFIHRSTAGWNLATNWRLGNNSLFSLFHSPCHHHSSSVLPFGFLTWPSFPCSLINGREDLEVKKVQGNLLLTILQRRMP